MESLYLYPSKSRYSGIVDNLTIYCTNVVSFDNMAKVLGEFKDHFPYVNVDVMVKSQTEILQALSNEPKSISIITRAEGSTSWLETVPKEIVVETFTRMPLFAITAKNNPSAYQRSNISVQELLRKKLVVFSQDSHEDTFVHEVLNRYGVPNIQHSVNNTSIFLDLLKNSDLWSIGVASHTITNTLLTLPFQEPLFLQGYLLYSEAAREDFIIKSFLQILRSY